MIFQGASVKSETSSVKHNWKLVHKCGFRFYVTYWGPSEHVELFYLSSKARFWGTDSRNRGFFSADFEARPKNMKPHFSINFQFCFKNVVSDFPGARRNITLRIPLCTMPYNSSVTRVQGWELMSGGSLVHKNLVSLANELSQLNKNSPAQLSSTQLNSTMILWVHEP